MTTTIQDDVNRMQAEITDAWLVAAQMNVYYEAIRRKGNRVVLGPADIRRIFTIISILLEVGTIDRTPVEARSHEPTDEEREQILDPPTDEPEAETPPIVPEAIQQIRRRMG